MAHVGQKFALHLVHFVELQIQLSLFVNFLVQVVVYILQRNLPVHQVVQHLVERSRQRFELVAGFEVGSFIQLSIANLIGNFGKVSKRFDDHVANDQPDRSDSKHNCRDRY